MAGTFHARTRQLQREVGTGVLAGHVVYDQVYAQYQHEGTHLRHRRGGQAKFLESALFDGYTDYYTRLGRAVTDGDVNEAMADAMEELASESSSRAPICAGNLRRSAHPFVTDGETVVYDRPPEVPRLSDSQLANQPDCHG